MPKIISANLNGIRSAAKKGFFNWMSTQTADFICVQELKAQLPDMTPEFLNPHGYHGHFHYAEKKGYSGTGVYSKVEPDAVHIGFGNPEFDAEGRYVRCDFGNLSVISVYCPSGSSGPERQEAKFRFMELFLPHLLALKALGREVVICGDWNIAHHEIDLKNWKGNKKNSGFLPEERAWLTRVLADARLRRSGLCRRAPRPGQARRPVHVVEQPRTSLRKERGLAHRLPRRHPWHRSPGAYGQRLQG